MFNVGRASDPPAPSGTYVVDAITAYSAVEGVLAAFSIGHAPERGRWSRSTCSMLPLPSRSRSCRSLLSATCRSEGRRRATGMCISVAIWCLPDSDGYVAIAMPNLKVLAELLDIPELATMDEHVDGYEQRGSIISAVRRGCSA